MKRTIYLEDIPLDEAWSALSGALKEKNLWSPLAAEEINIADAANRVTAKAIWAKISAPHYHASAMDGFAIRARDSEGATETNPLTFTLVEDVESDPIVSRPAQAVNTGHPLPPWANAVVMIEHTQQLEYSEGRQAIEIRASLPPWRHVRPMGEDMIATELVLPANHRLRPVDLGALAGSGHATVSVYKQPRVAIVPTGSELVEVEKAASTRLKPGQIIEYNSIVLAAQVKQWGGLATRWPIISDRYEKILSAVKKAARDSDLILVNAGSSAGSEDFTAQVVEASGQLLVHGVAVRPGHPVILGLIEGTGEKQGKRYVPVIGVPGYPVSAALTGEIFVEPLIATWLGQTPAQSPVIEAISTRKIASHTGDDDYVRVAVGQVGDKIMATPISRGAGVITSLVRADGIVRIPRFSEGVEAGTPVKVHLYRSPADIRRTIMAIGSHDLTLDLLAQFLAVRTRGVRLSSANVGSLGGLIALRRGEAHLAGSHLLDPKTGEYNVSYVNRYLPNTDSILVTLVEREQGWIVQPNNPLGLSSWADAANPEVQIVNRQQGAGTRVLLDYELNRLNIEPKSVRGYDREEFTHLAVAAAVASGAANAGLGIYAAANALNLDFVPLTTERYDLVIPKDHYESELLRPLLELLHDEEFQSAVAAMPGYATRLMGQRVNVA